MSRKKNILIVGGAGYIGSHTTLALNECEAYNTVVFDNLSTGHRDACFGDAMVEGDVLDPTAIRTTLRDHKIDCVVHFAALIEAGQSVITPLDYFENNVAGTVSLLKAMQLEGVSKLVFSSTAAVYGNRSDVDSLTEDLPLTPINPYGSSKAMVETILQSCVAAHGLQAIALRYFNASGADPQGRTGERHDPETHLIPLIIDAARGIRPHIKIYGTDYDTPDGTCIRDYIHVSDLAGGHVAAVNTLMQSDTPSFTPFNLGTGVGQSVREVIDAVRRVSRIEFEVIEEARRPGDPAVLVANAARASDVLGWQPKHQSIDTIVQDAWNYAMRNT